MSVSWRAHLPILTITSSSRPASKRICHSIEPSRMEASALISAMQTAKALQVIVSMIALRGFANRVNARATEIVRGSAAATCAANTLLAISPMATGAITAKKGIAPVAYLEGAAARACRGAGARHRPTRASAACAQTLALRGAVQARSAAAVHFVAAIASERLAAISGALQTSKRGRTGMVKCDADQTRSAVHSLIPSAYVAQRRGHLRRQQARRHARKGRRRDQSVLDQNRRATLRR